MFSLPQLDPTLEEPLYKQLYARIREEILGGRLAFGEKIPPTRDLAGLLGLNRTTVSAAYELLEAEGLIRGHVGRGSFVAGAALPSEIESSWDDRLAVATVVETSLPAFAPGDDGVSFISSRPAQDLFPLDEFRVTCEEVIRSRSAPDILQLGSPYGYAPLRELLLNQAQRDGLARPVDDLMVTNGCQQALDLLQRLFTTHGDSVVVEDPVYPGLKNVFLRAGVRVLGVPVGAQGMDVEALERLLVRERPRLLLVTPNFQNPTGTSMPLPGRLHLLRVAGNAGVPVVENDVYGDLRYTGEPVPSLKKLDERGDVIQIKSFSKIAFPGLRVGWVLGPRVVVARLAEQKQWTDLHTDQLSQAVLLRFTESGRLAAHRGRMIEAGSERLAAVLEACERWLPRGTRFTRPEGGMNLWVRLPEPLDTASLLARAHREQVAYLPGRYFAVSRVETSALRLSFAGLPPVRIRAGVAVLGSVFKKELEQARAVRRIDSAPAIV
jgi:2-aminoadipate transaminase